MGVQDYFGGAPRFGSQHTFLGRKADERVLATLEASEEVQVERVLGTSQTSRYGALEDRLRGSGKFNTRSDAESFDTTIEGSATMAMRLQEAMGDKPAGWTVPKEVLDELARYADQDIEKELGVKLKTQKIPRTSAAAGTGKEITTVANTYIGQNKYSYGGWDCSAFTRKVVKTATGVDISRSTASQIAWFKKKKLYTKNIKDARVGDILYFHSASSPSGRHTGVYIGNGMMIDNAGGGKPIKVRGIKGRRIIGIGLASRL